MSVIASLAAGKFTVTRDGVTAFDTSALKKNFNLVPDAALNLTGHNVTFPDLKTGIWISSWYSHSGSFWFSGCTSYVNAQAQEWGPEKTNVIADELLGTLPVKADYIDIRIKLTRTQAPTPYLKSTDTVYGTRAGQAWPQYLADGQWVNLDGYSTLVEGINNQIQRMIEFVFDPATGNISLRKRQSVIGTSPTSFINTTSRTTFGFYSASGNNSGIPMFDIQTRDVNPSSVDPGGAFLPDGSQKCNQTDPTDYTSIYSMDAVITPGRFSAAS